MYSDTEIDQAAERYLDSEYAAPEMRIPFHVYLNWNVRPTHHNHREEKGGAASAVARVAVAIRRTAGRRPSR
ncbi:MAG: hypothetical protein WC683_07800 [bacterium]|jgi:hypothetical protein